MNVVETNERGAFASDGIAYLVADAEGNETYFYAVEEDGGWAVESIEVPADENEDPGNQTGIISSTVRRPSVGKRASTSIEWLCGAGNRRM